MAVSTDEQTRSAARAAFSMAFIDNFLSFGNKPAQDKISEIKVLERLSYTYPDSWKIVVLICEIIERIPLWVPALPPWF